MIKFILAIIRPTFSWIRQLWKERNAARHPDTIPNDIADTILDRSLARLGAIDKDSSLWKKAISEIGGIVIRPDHFKNPFVRKWLTQNANELKQITKDALFTDKPQDKLREHLIDTYSSISGETRDCAETAVKSTVAVLKTALLQESKDIGTAAIAQEGFKSIRQLLDVDRPILISTQSNYRVESSEKHVNIDVQIIRDKLGDSSRLLLEWPQETDGHWIDRPELDRLYNIVSELLHRRYDSIHADAKRSPNVVVLIGAPGTGKSAILGRLGKKLMEESVILLAIKADQLPKSIDADTGIDGWLDCPVVESLRRLAVTHRVVALIDQLDALSELMDQHTERLSALLRLVQSIRRIPNLCVLLSCREFEYQNDIRLRSLEAESITLEVPPWEKVSPILTARGIDVAKLVDEQREMLQVPQHLAVFMTYFSGQIDMPAVSTYQALLEDLFENQLRKSYGSKTVAVAEYIATVMAKDEELWVARGRFDRTHDEEIYHLISEKIIVSSDNGLSIAFRHQTVFDFLRARSFLREDLHLKDFVVREKMQSLFVRPILWSALHYLRGSDRAVYRREMSKLWSYRRLRMHVRYLLVNFLGQLNDPDEQESGWLIPMLSHSEWNARILAAMAGSRGWFAKIRQRIPSLMIDRLDQAKSLLPVLCGAVRFAQDEVIALVERNWVNRRACRPLAWQVLANLRSWDHRAVQVMVKIVSLGPVNPSIEFVMQRISRLQPALASELLFQYLRSMDPQGAQAALNSNVWYGIEDLAKKEPRAFIRKGWTWLVDTLQQMVEEPDSHRYSYPSNFYRKDVGESLPKSFDVAICRLVETDIAYFLKLVRDNKNVDNLVVHQFLIHGLVLIAGTFPHIVRDYLLESRRRLAVGDLSNVHKDSRRLIGAVVPALSNCDVERLEAAVIDWKWTDDAARDPKNRFQLMKSMREDRLRLLLSFPKSRLSSAGTRYLTEGLRAFPCISDYSYFSTEVQEVVSPMSAEQMMKAHDEHIVSLFRCLTDDKESPPRLRLDKYVGGSLEASRSFAEFAKSDPHRALRIMDEFQAREQELPAGQALAALGATSVSSDTLISCIKKLDLRGFTSERFRSGASRCLHDLAIRSRGLDDPTCALLEQWMIDFSTELDQDSRDQRGVPFGHEEGSTGDGRSFLWDHGDGQVLPSGNYPILEALTVGYLYREPRDIHGWLGVLERHLGRAEKAEVWIAMARYLRFLGDRPQSIAFLEALFFRYPEILNHQLGVHLIAQVVEWIPIATLRRIIGQWGDGRWQYGPQVAGEVIALALCRGVDRKRMRRLIAQTERRLICSISHSDSLRVGIAHTLIVALKEPDLRSMVTPLVIRLIQSIRTSDRRLSNVVNRVLRESILLPDRHTERLLRVFLKASNKLTEVSTWHFTNGLKHLLTQAWNPRLIYTVTDAFLTQRYGSNQEPGDRFDVGEQLIEVALTLHNLPDTRREGLDLFERLLAWDSYSMNYRLRALDRHPS